MFKGDYKWVHKWEGHAGKPYWPGGISGVTLDPGVDLGHADPKILEEFYVPLMDSVHQILEARRSLSLKGERARLHLENSNHLQSFRVTRKQAEELFPLVAGPYWQRAVARWPLLVKEGVPPEVHTAILSLVYNRGANNSRLYRVGDFIAEQDWEGLGRLIADMQQNHRLPGIRRRRKAEGELILKAVVPRKSRFIHGLKKLLPR